MLSRRAKWYTFPINKATFPLLACLALPMLLGIAPGTLYRGATYDDLVEDYFITYKNYYKIDQEKDPEKYELIKTIHIDEMIRYAFDFGEQVNLLTANYKSQVDDYLQYIGLEEEQIHNLADKLKGDLS